MAKGKTNPPDKVGNGSRGHAPARQEDHLPVVRTNSRRCPLCKTLKYVEDDSLTARVTITSNNLLVAYMRMHEVSPENDGLSNLSDRFLAWLDQSKTIRAERRDDAALMLAGAFAEAYPTWATMLAEHLVLGKSARSFAEEVRVDDKTVGKLLTQALVLLRQVADLNHIYDSSSQLAS